MWPDKMSGAPGILCGLFIWENTMRNQTTFTEGKILAPLLRFALPVLLAMLLQAMYGAVDLLVVGQFASSADVSAVSTGSQLLQTITSVITGLSMGTTILLGQKIGEKKSSDAGSVIGASICLFVLLSLALTAVMLVFVRPLSSLMQAPEEAFEQTVDYIWICSAGLIFIMAYNLLGSIFRGIGNSKMPLITVAIACVINIFGDLLLVAVFHMGAAGAALATVFAQAVSVLLSFLIIRRQRLPFSFGRENLRLQLPVCKNVLRLGLPIALQDLLVNISFLVILAIVNSLGVIASAAVGVAEKLCMFVMLVPGAYMQSMSAFVAQNVGARKYARARRAMFCGIISSLLVGLFIGCLSFFRGDLLASIFSNDPQVILGAADYLKAYAIDCLLVSFLFCMTGYFNGCGKTSFVMLQGIIGAFLVRIPVSMLTVRLPEVSLFKIGLATPSATVVQIILCGIYYLILSRKMKQDSPEDFRRL
jgi:putative MATE family efflux protein